MFFVVRFSYGVGQTKRVAEGLAIVTRVNVAVGRICSEPDSGPLFDELGRFCVDN